MARLAAGHGLHAPSPRLRGEGLGEEESPQVRRQFDSRRVPLTRRYAPTSPRKRGEVKP
ncbi:hypothetical protein ABIA03_006060 [Bradyrhizobium yuanmingense]|uniref:Transposase n=1 Tax=Bradyrhizobium yuanmingense TaxID=108015 RepID=A0ABV4G7Y9_9BRAD